jgi:Flp pilus assembly protein TadG
MTLMSQVISLRRHWRQTFGSERGQALVEFALLLPLILFLVLGMVDVGKAINYWNDETHLANQAARYAAVNKSPVAGQSIEQAVEAQADSGELRNGTGSITSKVNVSFCFPAGETGQIDESLKATVRSTYKWLDYLGFSPATSNITAHSTQRLEKAYDNVTPTNNAYMQTGPNTC